MSLSNKRYEDSDLDFVYLEKDVKELIKFLKEYDIHDGNLLIPIKDLNEYLGESFK